MEIRLGQDIIGPGKQPLFLPDIDVYFKKDLNLAKDLISKLKDLGVKTIKGALIHDRGMVVAKDNLTEYFTENRGKVSEPYADIIERHVASLPQLRDVYSYAHSLGLDFVLSVYDFQGLQFARDLGACALKIPSSNIVHAPLIREAAASGLPLFIDTGRSRLAEIDRAVAWARAAGAKNLILQHSPPGPPAAPDQFHLRMMVALGQRYNCLCSLSDHYAGTDMMMLSVAMGAHVVEKGLCDDSASDDIDLAHALRISDVSTTLQRLDTAWRALGNETRELPADMPRPRDRMGLIASRDLEAGDIIGLDTVTFAFPTLGVEVERWDEVLGRRLLRKVATGTPISWGDIEGE
ncbi:hypothetical protein ASE66_13615 [Bosea sp. Root483D1]|uniref:N-acetylneuraminate synthase family protein n=1 Tax=Bosea sp. Root483D1 TaxID=1736544 RepID=UPI00070B8EF8|nr:N-acetylneuraminate synthase family protein [Bosea sp. Root483D1]KRE14413.1 hypothetical protein ASE66_13615 [Bosea sp. Root483D1]